MTLDRLPRPIGFVLGGGGSLGAIEVGMLQALSEHDLLPDLVAGCRPQFVIGFASQGIVDRRKRLSESSGKSMNMAVLLSLQIGQVAVERTLREQGVSMSLVPWR